MTSLDDLTAYQKIDKSKMIEEINGLPNQLKSAWEMGMSLPLPDWRNINQIVIAGMGGSAIGADLIHAYVAPMCNIPIFVHRNYGLPAWAHGEKTLVVASSHSGNTEETLSAFEQAIGNQCRIIAITTGGKLMEKAREANVPLWTFKHKGQPRAAVGYSFGLLLALLARLKQIPDAEAEILDAASQMHKQQKHLFPEIPLAQNPAKQIASDWRGHTVAVIGADFLTPVARRWKGQINEIAKTWAQFDELPEADHNTLAGLNNPHKPLASIIVMFLQASSCHPRNGIRTQLTQKALATKNINAHIFNAVGETRLAQMWTTLHFGDYAAYYLAIAYGVDPTPVESIESFKKELNAYQK